MVHGTWVHELTVSTQNWFWIICIRSRIFAKRLEILDVLVEKLNLDTFNQYIRTQCILIKTDFCVETVGSSRSFWVPWTFFQLIKGISKLKKGIGKTLKFNFFFLDPVSIYNDTTWFHRATEDIHKKRTAGILPPPPVWNRVKSNILKNMRPIP